MHYHPPQVHYCQVTLEFFNCSATNSPVSGVAEMSAKEYKYWSRGVNDKIHYVLSGAIPAPISNHFN